MSEPQTIAAARRRIGRTVSDGGADETLSGRKFLVTAGPTHEPIDPVRYIANRSSGKQGYAIAAALAAKGAECIWSRPDRIGHTAGCAYGAG